jgi:hypothetical protein
MATHSELLLDFQVFFYAKNLEKNGCLNIKNYRRMCKRFLKIIKQRKIQAIELIKKTLN